MFTKQISVFLENAPGRLADLTGLLGRNGIDMLALSVADTSDFGILRAIVADYEKALAVMQEAGFTASLTDVLAVTVPDEPGGLAGVLALLHRHNVSVEYIYSFVRHVAHKAVIILRVDNPATAQDVFEHNGVSVVSHEQITAI